jgi:hypothetical protein
MVRGAELVATAGRADFADYPDSRGCSIPVPGGRRYRLCASPTAVRDGAG